MDRFCRICMTNDGAKRFKRFFDKKHKFAENLFYISEVVVFEISKDNPALICHQCQVDLETAARIKKISLKSDDFFKSMSSTADIQLLTEIINGEEIEYKEVQIEEEPNEIFEEIIEFEADTSLIKLEELEDTIEATFLNNETPVANSTSPKKPRKKGWHFCPHEGCFQKYPKPSALKLHMTKHSDERNFCCNECGQTYKTSAVLRKHQKKHIVNKVNRRYICDHCGKDYGGRRGIFVHIQSIHFSSNKFKAMCSICGKKVWPSKLKDHMLYTHNPNQKDFECLICSKKFHTKSKLKQHVDNHGDRPWVCTRCGSAFSKRYKLGEHWKQVHKMKMEEESKFVCTRCGLKFDQKREYEDHLKSRHQIAEEDT